jgi:uncharacterized membrane protein YqhA
MSEIWDREDLYYLASGILLFLIAYYFLKYMYNWWEEVKKEPITVSQANAFGGILIGILLVIISITLIYSGFISPITHWLKYSK